MNKQRKNNIKEARKELNNLKIKIESILSDEENYYDNMPENLKYSERGYESEDSIDCLNEVIEGMEVILDRLDDIN